MNDKTAKILQKTNDGCTECTEYECPCGAGKIVYTHECGFGDFWAKIECEKCKNTYDIRTAYGSRWELIKK